MRIAFLVERPTQFEAPFFRFAAADAEHQLNVFFTAGAPAERVWDPELSREVDWGLDLVGGYESAVVPASGAGAWLVERLEQGRFDLLIANGYTRRPYLAGLLAGWRAGVPVGLRIDSVDFAGERLPRRLGKRLLFSLFLKPAYRLFFAVGSLTRQYLESYGVPAERIALFPYAVDVDAFARGAREAAGGRSALRARWGLPETGAVVLALAKMNGREAPWDLVEAAALLGSAAPAMVLAGDGPERPALEAFCRERGLDKVRFPGYVPYAELPALYAAGDLFVHAAREERWGVSVQEAMACGLPVVASSGVGAGWDLIRPGDNGDRYQEGDATALAGSLARGLGLPRERVLAANREILARWDYAASWRGILRAAERLAGDRPYP
ncbi:MAG TPA: glycosyltransferase [Thermoanaerobaculia bacterium]|nr:glycosyltransferase [Thermoanaerobaculia bacterium]